MAVRKDFPTFRDPSPGHWAYGMHERNMRNLWRILSEPQQQPKTGPGETESVPSQ